MFIKIEKGKSMFKKFLIATGVFFLSDIYLLANDLNLKNGGVDIVYEDSYGDIQNYTIQRRPDLICKQVNGGDANNIWGGEYAKEDIPEICKKTFVTTMGKLTPMKVAEGIDTFGELELIDFIKKSGKDKSLLLIDARTYSWYKKGTIPTAVNLPFKNFDPTYQDYEVTMDTVGVEYSEGLYNFENAKTLVLFCNGSWCPQSSWAIENLIEVGYPIEKLKWYRGGMYGWKIVNLTTVTPE